MHDFLGVRMLVPQAYRVVVSLFPVNRRRLMLRFGVGFRLNRVALCCHNGPFRLLRFLGAARDFLVFRTLAQPPDILLVRPGLHHPRLDGYVLQGCKVSKLHAKTWHFR